MKHGISPLILVLALGLGFAGQLLADTDARPEAALPSASVPLSWRFNAGENELELVIKDQDTQRFQVTSLVRHGNGDRSLQSTNPEKGSVATVTLGAQSIFGTISGPGSRSLLSTTGQGQQVMNLPETGVTFNSCGTEPGIQARLSSNRRQHADVAPPKEKRRLPNNPVNTQADEESDTVIDLLIVYNEALANRYPGEILATRLNHLVFIANQSMANSGLHLVIRLVGSEKFPYDNSRSNSQFRNDIAETLSGVTRPGLEGLRSLRDELGADLVIGLWPHDINLRGSCGIAFFPEGDPNTGVNVVADGSSSWSFCLDDVLTHEIGHNLGATHQIGAGGGVVDPRGSAFVTEGQYTTVMASFGTGRPDRFRGLAMFSNPELLCGGQRCGSFSDGNNAVVMNEYVAEVAAYRDTVRAEPPAEAYTRAAPDSDGDGRSDWDDAFPFDAMEQTDTDLDGTGDRGDAFPSDPAEQLDTDEDRVGNNTDTDDDGDDIKDAEDDFPLDPEETEDPDRDGVGSNADDFPSDASETRDEDDDGTGNNRDLDDDGDEVPEFATDQQDLLVVSAGNGRVLRFDALTGVSRGVEIPEWDSRITFQSTLAYRETDHTLIYTGDSGIRRSDLLNRQLLGEWVPPYALTAEEVQLSSGFPVAVGSLDGGLGIVAATLQDPRLRTYRGQAIASAASALDWSISTDDAPAALATEGFTAYILGNATRTLYAADGLGVRFLTPRGQEWMEDPVRMTASGDGRLLISDRGRNSVVAVHIDTGEFLGDLALLAPIGRSDPDGIAVTRSGELLVAAKSDNSVLAFDLDTGAFLDVRVQPGAGGLKEPGAMIAVPALDDRINNDPDRRLKPNAGLWFDPETSGRGFDIQLFGKRLSVIWYTYTQQGLPTWYLANGVLEGLSFEAPLSRLTLDQEERLEFEEVGTLSLVFDSERSASMSFNIGATFGQENLQWMTFTQDVVQNNPTGLWGREDGPGWGVSLASQGEVNVAIAYLYDVDGFPRWVISEPTLGESPLTFSMLGSFSSTLCPRCSGRPENELEPAGTMQLDLSGTPVWTAEIRFPLPVVGTWRENQTPILKFSEAIERPR